MSDALKEKVIEIALRMARARMAPATWGNVSARDPASGHVFITPSGMPYHRLTAADICEVDEKGTRIGCRWKPSTEMPLHCIFYKNKPDVYGIVHTHSLFATAFACIGRPIPVTIATLASTVGGEVPIAPYHSSGSDDFGRNALLAMGDKTAVLLGNHGVVAVGKDLDDAYTVAEVVENAAKLYAIACGLGDPICLPQAEIRLIRTKYLTKYGQKQPPV